jgi:hypothetical protein
MRIVGQLSLRRMPQAPRHPEVNQQSTPRLELNDQILAPALERGHTLAFELGGDGVWLEGSHEPWIGNLDAVEAPADDVRLELHANRLDLGELGH